MEMDLSEIKQLIQELSLKHSDIDNSITIMQAADFVDQLKLKRLKKIKLALKDEIILLKSKLIPDIEA